MAGLSLTPKSGKIAIYGWALIISLVDTSLNTRSEKERQEKADELCEKVFAFTADCPEMKNIRYIAVAYVIHQRKYLVVNFTNTFDIYQYEIEEDAPVISDL